VPLPLDDDADVVAADVVPVVEEELLLPPPPLELHAARVSVAAATAATVMNDLRIVVAPFG
jgi:hypothetical protein